MGGEGEEDEEEEEEEEEKKRRRRTDRQTDRQRGGGCIERERERGWVGGWVGYREWRTSAGRSTYTPPGRPEAARETAWEIEEGMEEMEEMGKTPLVWGVVALIWVGGWVGGWVGSLFLWLSNEVLGVGNG